MSAIRTELPTEALTLLSAGDAPVIVAVSGGSDSVALALLMNDAHVAGKLPPIHLVHLNHRIHGEEAGHDAAFVRRLAESLSLPVTVGEADVPSAARDRRISVEFAARECRYEFLDKVARDAGARWVAVGHTADDQIETIFHNILRGAGVHGLAGMPRSRPISSGSDIRIIRPLLDCPRRTLMDFLVSRGQSWRSDHTNLDTTYTRNRIRHELIPAVESSWPQMREELADFARELGKLDLLLTSRATNWISSHAKGQEGETIRVALDDIHSLNEPIESYVIRGLLSLILGDLRRIDEVHVRMVADLASAGSTGASLDLPRRLVVARGYDDLTFEKTDTKPLETPVSEASEESFSATWRGEKPLPPAELSAPGSVRWGSWAIDAVIIEAPAIPAELQALCRGAAHPEIEHLSEDPRERMRVFINLLRDIDPDGIEYLDCDRVGSGKLTVRSRVPGDRFTPLGAPGQTKLKDFLIRRKIPHAERDMIPLVVGAGCILVVTGLGVDNAASLTEETKRILKITCLRE